MPGIPDINAVGVKGVTYPYPSLKELSDKIVKEKQKEESMDRSVHLTEEPVRRREYPMATGLLDYFPNALAEVSRLSYKATQQHHPDSPMHWDRSKSTEHADKIVRHLIDRGKFDENGMRHSVMLAWRALALLQEELEREEGCLPSKAARNA